MATARLPPRHCRAVTADGTPVAIHLNISSLDELEALDPAICDGVGLVRTEFLFEGRASLPDEAAQLAAYRTIAAWAGGRPVTIRTLDAGGDKPIAGVTVDGESNPFLGVRGIRLSLRRAELFRAQLRALARAAAVHGNIRVMLPMVTVPDELAAAGLLLDEVLADLAAENVPATRPPLGIMVEVPAAALAIGRFAADFFSIGSNDLTQYATAAGRDIGAVSTLADPLHPGVLRLIEAVVHDARAAGRDVSLCGDAGGDPVAVPYLLRAGLRSLSVAPAALARTKLAVAACDLRRPAP
jgi:phosphotransferase system enzyme I (PtsI)